MSVGEGSEGMKKVVGVLLALVILGNLVMPAMAAEVGATNDVKPACPACSQNVVAIEVKGLEKSFILAKALNDKNLKRVSDMLTKKGYKLRTSDAKVSKFVYDGRTAEVAVIPMKSKQGEARLIYVSVNGIVRVRAIEAIEKSDPKKITVYRVVNGKVESYTLQVKGDDCNSACGLICGMSSATLCLIICAFVAENPLCDVTCAVLWGAACGAACSYVCTGNVSPCDTGCGAFCSGLCSAACTKMGPLAYFCSKYACSPACTGACGAIC